MSLFSNKSGKLIVSGDSYADATRRENFGFQDVWGNNIANFLESDEIFHPSNLINTANSGAGNTEIFNKTLDELIFNKNIKLVIVMWSEFQRMDFEVDMSYEFKAGSPRNKKSSWYTEKGIQILYQNMHPIRVTNESEQGLDQWPRMTNGRASKEPKWKWEMCKLFRERNFDSLKTGINKMLRLSFTIQELCEKRNIPLLQCLGTEPVIGVGGSEDRHGILKNACEWIVDHPYFDFIDKKKFIGWPMLRPLGGFSMDNYLAKLDRARWKTTLPSDHGNEEFPSHYRISVNDSHPNGRGHMAISELMYNEYKKIYSKN